MEIEGVSRDAVEFCKALFGEAPEVLNTVDVGTFAV